MVELKFNQTVANNGKQEFPISSSSNKNSVSSKKSTTGFQKVFNDSKNKVAEDLSQSTKTTQKTSDVVKETAEITLVDKPVVEKKEWTEELSKEEQEKIKKAVDLLLVFFEKYFPKQTEETEEIPEAEEENEILPRVEKVVSEEEKTKELAQVFSKELEITTELAQKILANLKELVANFKLSAFPEATAVMATAQPMVTEQLEAIIAQAVVLEKLKLMNTQPIVTEQLEAIIAQAVVPEQPANQQVLGANAFPMVEQTVVADSNSINPETIVQGNREAKNVEQTLKNLVEKPVVLVDPTSTIVAGQIEKLSSAQMPALQSHANFIVGKLNSDSMAKNHSKTVDKVADNAVTTSTIASQPTISMASLQTKLGQQFSDLQNHSKNNLEQSIKPLQEANQVKTNYAELLFPNNKNNDLENVELNLLQDRAAISRQIVDNIKVLQRNNNTEMVIKLKPEHMGEMILRISTNAAGTISASFQTNNPEARLALESTMLALKQELAANGLKVQDVDLFGGISDFLSGQSQANKDQKSNHSGKSFAEQQEEKVENIADKLGEQELTDEGNVDYRI